MKIAFIIHSFPNLSETFILNQIKGLLDSGYIVKIFAKSRSQYVKKHNELNKDRKNNRHMRRILRRFRSEYFYPYQYINLFKVYNVYVQKK